MNNPSVTGKLNQHRINQLYGATNHTLTVKEAATILKMPTKDIAKLMSLWVMQGHLKRVRRGLYELTPLDATTIVNPWITAKKVFHPCYIGGLSAAKHWQLVDESDDAIYVMTIKKPKRRYLSLNGIDYFARTIPSEAMFGLMTITCNSIEILISDPTRTIIDMLIDPGLGKGIDNVINIFNRYLKSNDSNSELLLSYAKRLCNGAVIKRLGYLLEQCQSGEYNTIAFCKLLMTSGHIKLDPKLAAEKLITRWGVWVPRDWI